MINEENKEKVSGCQNNYAQNGSGGGSYTKEQPVE